MTAGMASRGVEPAHGGWLFTGRCAALRRIVDWMRDGATGTTGALVVRGSSGSGKSALVGYLAALSDPAQRLELLARAPLGPEDPDPGVDAIDASVHLGGMDERDLAVALAERLGLPVPQAGWQLIAGIAKMASVPTVIVDGLDEAIPEHVDKIAAELLVALAAVARVLLVTQQEEFVWYGPPTEQSRVVELPEMFGRDVPIVDLDAEVDTAADIERYVARRLRAAGRGDLAERVAPVLAARAAGSGGFLDAWIMTSQLLRQVIDVTADGWQRQLATTVGAALDHDLTNGAILVRESTGIPGAARDLLRGLAWSLGRGMPQVVWQAAASALSPEDVEYRAADLDWVLQHYGCYIVEDERDSEVIYRLYHQEFVEHLLASPLPVPGSPQAQALAEALVALPEAKPPADGEPDRRSPYLRRHLARHASIAGTPGVDAVYRMVKDAPEVYLPELAVIVHQLGTQLAKTGQHEIALVPVHRAVNLYRVLAEANAVTYLPFLAMCLNDFAVYLAALGRTEASLAPGVEAADILRVLTDTDPTAHLPHLVTALNNLASHLAGLDRISDAIDVYTTCVADFAESPSVRDALIIERAGFHVSHGDPPTGLRELATLLALEETDTPDAIVLAARNALRGHRTRRMLDVDQAWWTVNRAGPPDWLRLTPEQLNTVVEWIAAPTWAQSKNYLVARESVLLADSTFTALEELRLLVAPRAERHLELLTEVTAVGIDEAYRPLLLEDLVADWISVPDWRDSQAFAEKHAADLVTPEAESALIRLGHAVATAVHLAVLGLARQDGLETAYGCVTDRGRAADRMRRALAAAEPDIIAWLALLEGRVFGEPFAAAAHLAVAGSLIGAPIGNPAHLEELAEQADVTERQQVAAEIAELIGRAPQHAGPLRSLPEILRQPTST